MSTEPSTHEYWGPVWISAAGSTDTALNHTELVSAVKKNYNLSDIEARNAIQVGQRNGCISGGGTYTLAAITWCIPSELCGVETQSGTPCLNNQENCPNH